MPSPSLSVVVLDPGPGLVVLEVSPGFRASMGLDSDEEVVGRSLWEVSPELRDLMGERRARWEARFAQGRVDGWFGYQAVSGADQPVLIAVLPTTLDGRAVLVGLRCMTDRGAAAVLIAGALVALGRPAAAAEVCW